MEKFIAFIEPSFRKFIFFAVIVCFFPVSYSTIPDLCAGDMSVCATTNFTILFNLVRIVLGGAQGSAQFLAFFFIDYLILAISVAVAYLVACFLVNLTTKK